MKSCWWRIQKDRFAGKASAGGFEEGAMSGIEKLATMTIAVKDQEKAIRVFHGEVRIREKDGPRCTRNAVADHRVEKAERS